MDPAGRCWHPHLILLWKLVVILIYSDNSWCECPAGKVAERDADYKGSYCQGRFPNRLDWQEISQKYFTEKQVTASAAGIPTVKVKPKFTNVDYKINIGRDKYKITNYNQYNFTQIGLSSNPVLYYYKS